jgi:hypothetical protein
VVDDARALRMAASPEDARVAIERMSSAFVRSGFVFSIEPI